MRTLLMAILAVSGVMLLGGCGGMMATDYVTMEAVLLTKTEFSGRGVVKGDVFLFAGG